MSAIDDTTFRKICIRCRCTKPADAFPNYKRYADGKHRYCKECHRGNVERHRRARGAKARLPLCDRFWSHVQRCAHGPLCPYCCWEWQRVRDKDGYGKFSYTGKKNTRAHRFVYELWNKQTLSKDVLACHYCDNPPCCNPLHIWIGTHTDNHHDRDRKGRGAWQRPGTTMPRVEGEKHPSAKLTASQVQDIRQLYAAGISSPKLARQFGIAKYGILAIVHRRIWKSVP